MEAKTESGFVWEIDKDAIADDWELVEYLARVESGEEYLMPTIAKKVLGEEGYKALREHVRDENGKMSTKKMISEIMAIFKSMKQTKN